MSKLARGGLLLVSWIVVDHKIDNAALLVSFLRGSERTFRNKASLWHFCYQRATNPEQERSASELTPEFERIQA
jgi:hypothetical protein